MLQHAEALGTSLVGPCPPFKLQHIQQDTPFPSLLNEQAGDR